MDIDVLIDAVIDREGGYADHPADRGGPTCWGVTEAVAGADGYEGAIPALPRPGLDQVARRAPFVAAELFDTGVNMGPAVASSFLQRALNALNRGAADYPDLLLDGRAGPRTLAALDAFLAHRAPGGETVLLKAL